MLFSMKKKIAQEIPGLTSINRKCLSYNYIHQMYGKMLIKEVPYNFKNSLKKKFELVSLAI